ncbi:MAG: gamma-glutamylcyclotransferase [Dokdonella sp.]
MSLDTITINQRMDRFDAHVDFWLFGYGSLIYKADFAFLERRPATMRDRSRRLWQGSQDHRGTPESPGRVATLIDDPGARCIGMAYRVSPEILAHLDRREKNGYLRVVSPIVFDDGVATDALVYIATAENAAWLGPASEHEVARQIRHRVGPSGSNHDYVVRLAQALAELGARDAHVETIARLLNETERDG